MMARATKRYAQAPPFTGHAVLATIPFTTVLKEDVIPEALTINDRPESQDEYDHNTSMENVG